MHTTGLFSCRQIIKSKPDKVVTDIDAVDSTKNKGPKTQTDNLDSFIDTEFKYTDSEEKKVIIQNSYPRGGGDIDGVRGYSDSTGTHYGYGIFWTRIINETNYNQWGNLRNETNNCQKSLTIKRIRLS